MRTQGRFLGSSSKFVQRRRWPNTGSKPNGIPVVIPLKLEVAKRQLDALRVENLVIAIQPGVVAEHRCDRERIQVSKYHRQHEIAGGETHRTRPSESGRWWQHHSISDDLIHSV